jgi:hypothetical protein
LGFLALAPAALVVGVACGDDEGGGTELEDFADSGPPPIRADARTNGPDAEASLSTIRLAHLAAETGPLDFCYQEAHAGTFFGPVLGGPALPSPDAAAASDADDAGDADAAASDADDAGDTDAAASDADDAGAAASDAGEVDAAAVPSLPSLAYGEVTKYLVLQSSGPMTIAIVVGGATSCASPIAKGDVTLDPGKLSTVAVFSRPADGGAPALEVAAFTDDRTTATETARVRVIHAALGTSAAQAESALAVRASAAKTTVLADRVEPRHAATPSEAVSVDALGYVTTAPIPPPATIAVGPAPTDGGAGFEPWLSKPYDLGLTGGSLHTAFIMNGAAVPAPTAADAATARKASFRLLWCADTTTQGDRTTCGWVR